MARIRKNTDKAMKKVEEQPKIEEKKNLEPIIEEVKEEKVAEIINNEPQEEKVVTEEIPQEIVAPKFSKKEKEEVEEINQQEKQTKNQKSIKTVLNTNYVFGYEWNGMSFD